MCLNNQQNILWLWGKIGVLPTGQVHISARVSGTKFMWGHKLLMSYLPHSNLFWRLTKRRNLFVKVSHGRFHDILPKEYSGTLPELLLGKMICYKMKKYLGWKQGSLPENALWAFCHLPLLLCSQPVLAYPQSDQQYALMLLLAMRIPQVGLALF